MKIDFEEILSSTVYNSRRNHIIAKCPYCDKEDHFFFNVVKTLDKKDGKYVNCWDCKKCGQRGNIVKLLRKLNKLSLLEGEYLGDTEFLISPFVKQDNVNIESNFLAKEIFFPIGFKRIHKDEYLTNDRHFTDFEFKKYKIGVTELYTNLKDYIIILIEEQGKVRGYIARSRLSKEQIKKINSEYKQKGIKKKYLRYRNSTSAEFNKLLGGYEEIMFTTKWVILVEGFFDKVRVDQALGLDRMPEMKCCCTYGKDISNEQIKKITKKGIKNIIIIQDPDAVNNSKTIGERLMKDFDNVLLGFTGDKDLGDSKDEEILSVFDNLKTPLKFRLDIVQPL